MGAYALSILALIKFKLKFINPNEINAKEIDFEEEVSVANILSSIKNYWAKLTSISPKCGCFPKPAKYYLIVKENKLIGPRNLFSNSIGRNTTDGRRHLGTNIRSIEYCDECVKDLLRDWSNQLTDHFVNYCKNTSISSLVSIFLVSFKTN